MSARTGLRDRVMFEIITHKPGGDVNEEAGKEEVGKTEAAESEGQPDAQEGRDPVQRKERAV
jgi:hypothetical protein